MKSAFHRSFATDKPLETTGVWVRITDEKNEDGTTPEFLIMRAGGRNTKYQRTLDRVSEPFRAEIEAKTLPAEQADALEAEILVDGVLLDWRYMQDEHGENLTYDRDVAIREFTDNPDGRVMLTIKARSLDTFRLHRREVAAKN